MEVVADNVVVDHLAVTDGSLVAIHTASGGAFVLGAKPASVGTVARRTDCAFACAPLFSTLETEVVVERVGVASCATSLVKNLGIGYFSGRGSEKVTPM